MAGILYMIPCPIGDFDHPYEVLPATNGEIMQRLDYFIVENSRTARRFLSRANIGRPIEELELAECNEHTHPKELEQLIKPLLEGRSAGLISEAGVPGIADPGADVAALCHRRGIRIVPLVGPSSILLALMASGQNGQSFAFNGYLPVKPPERDKAIRRYELRAQTEGQSQLFIEAPYRNVKLFDRLLTLCHPGTLLTVALDITMPSESIRTAPIQEWRDAPPPPLDKHPAIFIIGSLSSHPTSHHTGPDRKFGQNKRNPKKVLPIR